MISRARVDLALSGRVDALDGSARWPGSDRNVRNTLLGLLADPANAWAAEKLVDAVVRLATTVDSKRQARKALLGLLPGRGSGFEAARFMSKVVGGVVQLAVTAADKRVARAALLRRLAGQADGWLADELATGISQLSPSDRQRRLVRDTLLALVPGQGDDGEAVWLVGRAAHLARTGQEKRETRDRILGLLAGRFRGWVADEMTAIATRLFPAADHSQARDALPSQADSRKADNPTSWIVWRGHAAEDDGQARDELLKALASETDGRTAAGIAAARGSHQPDGTGETSGPHDAAEVAVEPDRRQDGRRIGRRCEPA